MRVLILNHFPLAGSGSGIYVKNIAKGLVERGHQVCIVMPENTTDFEEIDGVKIHPVYFKRDEVIEGQAGFNFPCMDPHPRSNFLYHNMSDEEIKEYEDVFEKAIEEEIRVFNPDVIHAQHIWVCPGILSRYDVPFIITSHGAEFITYRKTDRFDEYGMAAVAACQRIVAISDDNIKDIISKFTDSQDKIVYLKNGYNSRDFYKKDVDRDEILKKYNINGNFDKVVLFVGRISQMKGLDILMKAARLYEKENVLTLIAGDGDYKFELMEMIDEFGLKNIVFLGNQNQVSLNDLYNISDLFVLPSRKEALPLVAIESMACGTPVVVTNQYGMADIVTENVGRLFNIDDDEMLADQITRILDGEIEFDKEQIISHAKDNYSQDVLIDNLVKIFEEIKK